MAVDVLADRYWSRTLLRMVKILDPETVPSGADLDAEAAGLLDGLACANCGGLVDIPSAHCDYFCKDLSKAIRYARKATSEARLNSADFKEGLGTKLISLFKGGYPTKERAIPPEVREAIFVRDQRVCQLCSDPADEIDHINGNSCDPENLRAVCGSCNRLLAMTITRDPSPEELADFIEFANGICADMALRIAAPQALHCCDDFMGWAKLERAIRTRRTRYFKERAEEDETDFEDVDGYLAYSMQKDD